MSLSKWFDQPLTRLLGLSLNPASSSPFEKLPAELIVLIFYHVVSSFQPPVHASSWIHVQNLLSQVSKRWHAIVTSTPSLQSSLPISVTIYPWPVLPNHATIASLDKQLYALLATQANCERVVSLRIETTGLDDLVDRVARSWPEACNDRQTSALRSVSLKGANHTMWHGSQFFNGVVAPTLSTLIMEDMPISWFEGPRKGYSPPNLTTVFPSLKTVELDGPVVDFKAPFCLESKLGALRLASGLLHLRFIQDSDTKVYIADESKVWRSLRELLVSSPPLRMLLPVQPAPLAVQVTTTHAVVI
ncbi:hypothetical protein JVU11DRAFT_6724 [Chiua virens]|nr:hypothetical protein JVU11DRAFT_6724 [Chiua virens]